MKQWIVAALVLALVLALGLMLAGCSTGKVDSQKIATAAVDNRMFMIVSHEFCGYFCGYVLVDKTTRVMYWMSEDSHNYGILTLLVNPDGTPRIWEG